MSNGRRMGIVNDHDERHDRRVHHVRAGAGRKRELHAWQGVARGAALAATNADPAQRVRSRLLEDVMGLDLELVPIYFVVPLSTDRDYELWVEIGKIGTVPSPDFDSERCGNPPTDARGRPLVCVTAGELAALAGHHAVATSECNRAAWAYLAALRPDRLVALYWC